MYLTCGQIFDGCPKCLLLLQVQNTFRDLDEANILRSYMSDAIQEISNAAQAFEAKESAPPIAGRLALA